MPRAAMRPRAGCAPRSPAQRWRSWMAASRTTPSSSQRSSATSLDLKVGALPGVGDESVQLASPSVEAADAERVQTGRMVPVYRLTEGLKEGHLRRWLHTAVEGGPKRTAVVTEVPDALPPAIRERRELLPLSEALKEVHF